MADHGSRFPHRFAVPRATHVVDVWFARIRQPGTSSLLDGVRGRLDAWEEERVGRLRRTEDQVRFVAAHALVRVLLSALHPVEPAAWRLSCAATGKPFVTSPRLSTDIRFSLSHTAGLVGCAATTDAEVGFDVENVARRLRVEALASHTMTPDEIAGRTEAAGVTPARWFLRHWTLKEALVKAAGVGLRVSPRSVEVWPPESEGPARITSLPPELGEVADWQAYTIEPLETHVAAVAAEATAATKVNVRWKLVELDDVLEAFG